MITKEMILEAAFELMESTSGPQNLSQLMKMAKEGNMVMTMIRNDWGGGKLLNVPRTITKVQTKGIQFEGGSWLTFDNGAKGVKFDKGNLIVNLGDKNDFSEVMVYTFGGKAASPEEIKKMNDDYFKFDDDDYKIIDAFMKNKKAESKRLISGGDPAFLELQLVGKVGMYAANWVGTKPEHRTINLQTNMRSDTGVAKVIDYIKKHVGSIKLQE